MHPHSARCSTCWSVSCCFHMMQRSWIELCAQPVNPHILRLAGLVVEHRRACWHRQSASIWLCSDLSGSRASSDVCNSRSRASITSAVHARRVTFAARVPTAATTTVSTPMIVEGSPPVRRRAAAGVASTCLLPSTELRTRARSDSLAILVATFLPATCSCVAVERSPGLLLGFRCRALARSRSRLATLKASLP